MPFAPNITTSAITGSVGFALTDPATGWTDRQVAFLGDVNGDGLGDYLVTSPRTTGVDQAGTAYIVFGTGTPPSAELDLASLDGTNGFRIDGQPYDRLGYAVAAGGDLNGDGFADVLIYAKQDDSNGDFGQLYVLLGGPTFNASLDLTDLDGSNGAVATPLYNVEDAHFSIAGVGDVNGDGVGDFIVGEVDNDASGYAAGAVYVVFGDDAGFPPSINLAALDGTDGFTVTGGDYSVLGYTASAAGDFNGDGVADLMFARGIDSYGEHGGSAVYVVYGSSSGFQATLDIADLDGTNGFRISGASHLGFSLSAAGDVNGDGFGDIIIGSNYDSMDIYAGTTTGAAYIVFGSAAGYGAELDVADLNGVNGFKFVAEDGDTRFGYAVTGGGDLNGDGYADVAVGSTSASGYDGGAWILLGHAGPFAAAFGADQLDGLNGFAVRGENGETVAGAMSMGGDLNGDGLDDLILATRAGDQAYVMLGQRDDDRILNGAGTSDRLMGGSGDDVLSGMAGQDVLYGATGTDNLDGGDNSDRLYGQGGDDTLLGGLGGDVLDGGDGVDQLDGGDGADKLYGGAGADTLTGGEGNDRFDGGADADTLTGGDGNDYLDGGAGADTMTGGLGNDVYVVDSIGDQTIEGSGGGYDIVRTALGGLTLAANIEAMELQGSGDIAGSGNAGNNNLQGNSGSNTLFGNGGVDTINGNDGDDFIVGGAGNDLLRGGLGADTFVVGAESVGGGALETDQVYDFSAAEGDIVDLSGVFGGTISLVSAFSKAAGQMTLTFAGGITTLKLDVTGDGRADYQMKLNGDVTGESGDWLL